MTTLAKMATITGSEVKSKSISINSGESVQPTCDLEHTIDCMEKTTIGGGSGFCPDPRHCHSFRSIPFILLPFYTCAGCGERLQPYAVGGIFASSSRAAVQCIACGVYAHRHCAFSKQIEWQTKCTSADYDEYIFEDTSMGSERAADAALEHVDDDKIEKSTGPTENIAMGNPKELLESNEGNGSDELSTEISSCQILSRQDTLNSIFRSEFKEGVTGFPECRTLPSIIPSASMDNDFTKRTTQKNVQYTKANFPFLSSASLLPSHNVTTNAKNPELTIRKCQSWNEGVISPSSYYLENKNDSSKDLVTSRVGTEVSKDAGDDIIDPNVIQNAVTIESETNTPLHFASHGFQVVSQALQDNIVANFNRLIPNESSRKQIDNSDSQDSGNKPDLKKEDYSTVVYTKSEEQKISTNEKGHGIDYLQARTLLETSEPQKESAVDRKRIGLATVAGTIVGGVVGVGLAGPLGGVIGVKCGQTAGMLGLLLEGSVTASVLASGIGVGIAAGQHIQEKHETRVIALGEGTKQRVLLMVRPTIKAPEPIWDELYQEARRSYSGNNTGIVSMLIPNESRAAKRDRYEREVDIVETGDDELAIADKVLLLTSRILSNKDSLPGHVYRKFIEAFRCRCHESSLQDLHLNKQKQQIVDSSNVVASSSEKLDSSSITKDEVQDEDKLPLHMYQRRQDAHAVIKYVTTSLLLTRPGFGYSSSITEKTATAVESLVFGVIYDLVVEEIETEYQNKDNLLLHKIADFERKQALRGNFIRSSDDSCFGYKSCISEAALEALHNLPQAHSAVDKLRYCVAFLEQISEKYSKSTLKSVMGADSLLKMVCQHILLAKMIGINSQIAFLEEFARDEQLLRGREGYALVTLQASLHFLNASKDFETDIFSHDED